MAVPGTKLNELIENAPSMTHMQRSLAETVFDYAEADDRDGVGVYCETMSKEGLARLVKDLMMILPIAKSKLMQK